MDNDGLATLNPLKIQSTPFRNTGDSSGDEMNMHIPQSLQTFVELEQICLVPQNIISPGTSKPSIAITQDTLVGAYLMTNQNDKITREHIYNYMMFEKDFNGILPTPIGVEYGKPYWSGKQLFSLILPDINIVQLKSVKIIRGCIEEGYLNEQTLGSDSAGLIKQIYNAYGVDRCVKFLNNTEKLITRWMVHNSFSISFGDSIVKKPERISIKDLIKTRLEEAFDLIKKAQHGIFANDLDDIYKKSALEFNIVKVLRNIDESVQNYIMERISKTNNFYITGDKGAGAKGKSVNIRQIMGCVGQQDIWGSRIEDGFTERTLPHFPRNDMGPDAKGYCRNSYIEGLSPSEMFFHAMGGRTGTIDTAIKSVTGDTPIIINERGVMKYILIGDWIDAILDSEKYKPNVQNLPEKEMELLELDYEAHIPTTDLDGNVSWGLIKNITRHDPGKELYEIKSASGRKVIVTESHSLLIWNCNSNSFERKSTPEVKVGDFVPVSAQLCSHSNVVTFIDLDYGNIFKLIPNNGLFLGLFITFGYYIDEYIELELPSGKLLGLCELWFQENNYEYELGSNYIIRSFSTNLIYILEKMCSIDPCKRFIHPQCFSAGLTFINDLISGLNINKLKAKSTRLLEDINFCLSRVGLFGKVDFSIMNIIINPPEFDRVNDTILDPIIEINSVPISRYPKVYDLTIPSTLNFGLANGLHVVDTADSGYTSRKFIKAAEDLMINYDMTVRNASNFIVQFGYGDDNFDPVKLEKVTRIELIEYDNHKMEEMYKYESIDDEDYFENFMSPDAIKDMMSDDNYKNIMNNEYEQMLQFRSDLRNKYFKNCQNIGDVSTYIPINLYRVIPSQLIKFNIENFHISDLTPKYIIETYEAALKDMVKYLPEKEENWKLFKVIFKSFLASKRVIKEYRMSKMCFDSTILLIKEKMFGGFVSPGEMVGIIGAQTLGEISTQLTLNTFHLAGVGAGSLVITEGIPRLREIINLTKNLKNKNMTIFLKKEYSDSKENARKLKARFEYTQLKDILGKTEILFDNKDGFTEKSEDREFIKSYKEFAELFDIDNIDEECLSPWILRLTFDKESLMNRKITIQEIQETIKEKSDNPDEIDCIYSDDSANDVIMRIKIKQESKSANFLEFMKDFEKQLIELSLRGVSDIKQVEMAESNLIKYNDDGSFIPAKEWVLKTQGSNMLDILAEDAVDSSRTETNDIIEFYEIFGIEATRNMIYAELMKVYNSNNPNPRHIQMLADIMTYRGKLMQIDRHGLNKNPETGPMGKASFEEVMNIFTKAALFAEKDNMKGVSSNIFAGQFCKSGTNSFEILMDEDKLMEKVFIPEYVEPELKISTEADINKAFNVLYEPKEEYENVQDEDFEFGFGMEMQKQHELSKSALGEVIIKENAELPKSNNNNVVDVNIEVPKYEPNINFEEINIEEPQYTENNKTEVTNEPVAPTASVSETNNEENLFGNTNVIEEVQPPKKIKKVIKKKVPKEDISVEPVVNNNVEPEEKPIKKTSKKIKIVKK